MSYNPIDGNLVVNGVWSLRGEPCSMVMELPTGELRKVAILPAVPLTYEDPLLTQSREYCGLCPCL